jgi:recombination protein U
MLTEHKGELMNSGKVFENNWKKSIPENVYYMRIKDSPSSFGMDSAATRFTLQNPFDGFIFYDGCFFPLELKSTQSSSMSIQRDKSEKSKMIKLCQIDGLQSASVYDGVYAGFLMDFRGSESTFYFAVSDFVRFLNATDKKSINEKDVIEYGGIIIQKQKKKIHYKYDVLGLLSRITERRGT